MFLRFLTRVAGVSVLVVGLLTGVVVGTASACQCLPGGEPERYARATHVFAGVVIGKVYESPRASTTRSTRSCSGSVTARG